MVSYPKLLPAIADRLRPPLVVISGPPRLFRELVDTVGPTDVVSYQMDLFPAERLRQEMGADVRVETWPDLWDLPAEFQTVVYPVPTGGERSLKIDMVEQAFHVLRPGSNLVVLSPYANDGFFPPLLKKVFGRFHMPMTEPGTVLWARRDGDRPRRRHEMAFQARIAGRPSLRFLSRPGTFSYGRLDQGARALAETMEIQPGDRVVDLGCGCGTNGIFAAQQSGLDAFTAFVDSNLRAVALAELNARANGLLNFQVIASSTAAGLEEASFDVALANPPYFAQDSIARLFIERSRALLRPGGRLFVVTKQVNDVAQALVEEFGDVDAIPCRGYMVLRSA